MTNPSDQLRRQNQSLLSLLNEIDIELLFLDNLVEFEKGTEPHRLWTKLLVGVRARDTANHSGDMIAGAKT